MYGQSIIDTTAFRLLRLKIRLFDATKSFVERWYRWLEPWKKTAYFSVQLCSYEHDKENLSHTFPTSSGHSFLGIFSAFFHLNNFCPIPDILDILSKISKGIKTHSWNVNFWVANVNRRADVKKLVIMSRRKFGGK